jgi:hypothetical protein
MFNRREVLGMAYSERSIENARKARDDLFGDQNNRKRYDGYLAALLDPEVWSLLQAREQKLRDAIGRDPKLGSTAAAYERIKKAQAELVKIAPRYDYLEQERPITVGYRGPRALYGNLFKYARLLTRDRRTRQTKRRAHSGISRQRKGIARAGAFLDRTGLRRLRNIALNGFAHRFRLAVWRKRSARAESARGKITARARRGTGLRYKIEGRCGPKRSLCERRARAASSA